MKEPLIAELTKIIQAVTILSPTSFSFAGSIMPQSDPIMQQIHQLHSLYPSQNQLVIQLQQTLYTYCYCKRFTGHLAQETPTLTEDNGFVQMLSQANTSHERWDAGWQIYQTLPSGQILAHKYGLTRMLWPGEFLAHEGFGMAPRVGTKISIFVARESRTMQPGFYFVFGETVTDQQDDYSIVRFYWHIKDSVATNLIQLITQKLNRFQVPFRLKCLSVRSQFKRADAAVLFVSKRYYRITSELLAEIHQTVREDLRPETPLFTKQFAHGLGFAEDPGNGESFGMNRCRIFAEGLWSAYTQGLHTEQARLQEVVQQFEKNGISLEHPYLNAGAIDHYEFASY